MTKITNHKSQITTPKGFTLVELLVAVAVIVVVGSIIAVILITALRGSNKTATLTLVRQNGNFAISQMSKTLRDSRGVQSMGGEEDFSCVSGNIPPVPVEYDTIEVNTLEGGFIEYACDIGNDTISSASASLLDSTAVDLASCYFTCSQESAYDAPTIGIYFTLLAKNQGSLPEFTASSSAIPFQTSITLRNLTR